MPLLLTPEQDLVKSVVREFAKTQLEPEVVAIDRESRFARDHYERAAPLGLLGLLVPAEGGGSGTDTLSYVVALEEVARVSGTDAAMLVLHNALLTRLLHTGGSEAQRRDLLAPALSGTFVGATAIMEEASGSSMDDVITTAEPRGDGYRLNGGKAFVSLAGVADAYVVLARAAEGPTLFVVPSDREGLHVSASESKLGLRGLPLAQLFLNRVEVPSDAVLGARGGAADLLKEPFMLARLGVAAALVGLTQRAWELSVAFARGRVQFGQPIIQFGAIRGFLADLQADLEATRAIVHGAAALRDAGKDYEEEVYEGRLLAHRTAVRGTRVAHKIHGGAGFMRELPLERVSRDVRTLMHFWDAHDVVRSRLANHVLR